MSAVTNSPPPEPDPNSRPDLQVVRDTIPEPDTTEEPDTEDIGEDTAAVDNEDQEPLLDSNGDPVTPRPPLDIQFRETLVRHLHGIPAFGQSPPSFAEAVEYSQNGDWATSANGAKRAAHGLATILAFLATYPLVDLLGRARTKPGPFAVALLIVIALLNVLGAVL